VQPAFHTEFRNTQGEWPAASQFATRGGQTYPPVLGINRQEFSKIRRALEKIDKPAPAPNQA